MFNYAMVLASIIIGLALTHLMQGLVGLVTAKVRIWWVHLVWVAFMLLTTVAWWWWEYSLRQLPAWTFQIYVFVLLYAFCLYVASALLFPREMGSRFSYAEYFLSHRRWFFGAQIALTAIDFADSALKGRAHLHELGTEYWISSIIGILLFAVAIATPRKRVQALIAVVALIYQASWFVRLFQTIQ